jgi:methanogenic corrinoid protein MtbC1
MTKHLTSFEGSAGDIAKFLEEQPQEALAASRHDEPAWRDLLSHVIEREILPRLLGTQREPMNESEPASSDRVDGAAVIAFVELIIADDVERLRAVADRVILFTGGRDGLLNDLLAPAARLLGQMWDEDSCDFTTVTLGIYRLNQIMKETQAMAAQVLLPDGFEHRILLLPAPGEQHDFGIKMVADAFRADGWCVRSTPAVSRKQLLGMVREEWFDVIGLSVSTERWLKGLPACIRAVRTASCNPRSFVMLGGYAIIGHAERSRFLGADSIAEDAEKALQQANNYMETTVTGRFCQFITKPVDAGRSL